MKTKAFVLALVFGMPNLRLVSLLNTLQICLGFVLLVFFCLFVFRALVEKGDGPM